MEESKLEKKLKDKIESLGGLCIKFYSPYRRGLPDRILILPNGYTKFVEVKREKGKLSKLQKVTIAKFKSLGHKTFIVNSQESLENCLKSIEGDFKDGI